MIAKKFNIVGAWGKSARHNKSEIEEKAMF